MATLKAVSEAGLAGGIIYDALIARLATKDVEVRILTFNFRDFERLPNVQKAQLVFL